MTQTKLQEKYKEVQEKLEQLKAEFVEIGRLLFQELVRDYFNEWPFVLSFAWEQGTPGFCDGDPCHFSVYSDSESMSFGIRGYDDVFKGYDLEDHINNLSLTKEQFNEVALSAETLVESIDYSILESLFGDGYEVTITREGVSTSRCYIE